MSFLVFLKRLTIKGFKSFADVAALEMEPGVTVVVGPNGSGKSNVVDAIAWVLGAQAPSSVRAQKMDDVIFAGTASKPALGRAEVSLTIDNESGLLPIEFSEVTITRTLFRSGDSEYSINCITKWAPNWELKNWKRKGKDVANKELIATILNLYRKISV